MIQSLKEDSKGGVSLMLQPWEDAWEDAWKNAWEDATREQSIHIAKSLSNI